ncbi:MAG: hypothetical protein GC171_01815 [Terrimonas sp.]|nr:hypothetical protein [Terrimonas sp.]
MDLENLKEVWQKQQTVIPQTAGNEDLHLLLTRQSKSPIAKMKRNLRKELFILLLSMGAVIVYYFMAFKGKLSEVSWVYLLITVLFAFYFYKKNKLLNEMECAGCHVKSNLELQVSTLEKYVRLYLFAGTYMIPVLFIFLGWIFYLKMPFDTPKSPFFHSPAYAWWQNLLTWLILSLVITIPFYFLNKWYVHHLYGKHINRLKGLLQEMEAD